MSEKKEKKEKKKRTAGDILRTVILIVALGLSLIHI